MDGDRSQANVEKFATTELPPRGEEKPREPKKRFVGRRTVAESASSKNDLSGTIEETGVVQGKFRMETYC